MHDAGDLKQRLSGYLGTAVENMTMLGGGWETVIFAFSTSSDCPRLGIKSGRPLALRVYQGESRGNLRVQRGAREYAALESLSRAGFAVPHPFVLEQDPAPLGNPFLVMERLSGCSLLQRANFANAVTVFTLGFFDFVRKQAQLHKLDPIALGFDKLPGVSFIGAQSEQSLLTRMLTAIRARVEGGPLPSLIPALAWAEREAARFAEAKPSAVHLDYHPLNVLVAGTRISGVIDWVNADCGDRHLDAAMTAAIISSSAFERPRWLRKNCVGNGLRAIFSGLYFPLYHAMAPMALERFRYCQAVAALLRLSMMSLMRKRGVESLGFRHEALADVTPPVLALLSRQVQRKSGVPIRLDPALMVPA